MLLAAASAVVPLHAVDVLFLAVATLLAVLNAVEIVIDLEAPVGRVMMKFVDLKMIGIEAPFQPMVMIATIARARFLMKNFVLQSD